jgi:hypothetical protein
MQKFARAKAFAVDPEAKCRENESDNLRAFDAIEIGSVLGIGRPWE